MPWRNVGFRGTTKGTNTIALFGGVVLVAGIVTGAAAVAFVGGVIFAVGAGLTILYLLSR